MMTSQKNAQQQETRVAAIAVSTSATASLSGSRDVDRHPETPSPQQRLFENFAEACLRFTPRIALRSPHAGIFLDLAGCRWKQEQQPQLSARIRSLARRFFGPQQQQPPIRIGFGPDPFSAWAAATLTNTGSSGGDGKSFPIEALSLLENPFAEPTPDRLRRLETLILVPLRALGITTFDQYQKLSAGEVASRFGKEGLLLHQRARLSELSFQRWPRFTPPEKILEERDVSDPESGLGLIGLEPLLFQMRPICDRFFARLHAQGMRLSALRLELVFPTMDATASRQWRISLAVPQGSTHGLLPLLATRLATDLDRAPLPAPIEAVRLEAIERVPGRGAQRGLLNPDELENNDAWDALLGRLREKLSEKPHLVDPNLADG
ncbi:MAG: hypothetical protein AAB425_09150, partial [Bdellovibrionota bacterium]